MDEDESRALREQIAALTAAVATLAAQGARPSITVRELYADFERAMRTRPSWKDYRNRLLPLVRRLGDLPASELSPTAWADHAEARGEEKISHLGRKPKAHTLTIEFWRANQLLNHGVKRNLLAKNPLNGYTPPKTISQRETWLDEAGFQQLLGGIPALDDERIELLMTAFILLCCDSMMRFNEARRLRRDRIRDEVAELSARGTKNKKARFLGLTPRTLVAVDAMLPVLGSPYLFANPKTRALYSESTIRDWFAVVCHAAGIHALAAEGERVVIHTLRHSGASAADAAGASARTIQDALGHAFLATTERYLHRHKREGAKGLADLMARHAAQRSPTRNQVTAPEPTHSYSHPQK